MVCRSWCRKSCYLLHVHNLQHRLTHGFPLTVNVCYLLSVTLVSMACPDGRVDAEWFVARPCLDFCKNTIGQVRERSNSVTAPIRRGTAAHRRKPARQGKTMTATVAHVTKPNPAYAMLWRRVTGPQGWERSGGGAARGRTELSARAKSPWVWRRCWRSVQKIRQRSSSASRSRGVRLAA